MDRIADDATSFFSRYLEITGVVGQAPRAVGHSPLFGKRLGLLNGSSWVALWSNFFARLYLPGVQLLTAGNDAVQFSFMRAHEAGQDCLPPSNVERFARYAKDLVELGDVHAVLITCSTMSRSHAVVEDALKPYGTPVVQIDMPMMEEAVAHGGRILVVATHGPTVTSTSALLEEAASRLGRPIEKDGLLVEKAWSELVLGNVEGHNAALADAIKSTVRRHDYSCVVLAQLTMASLLFSFPQPSAEFGLPILNSAQCGFKRIRRVLEEI